MPGRAARRIAVVGAGWAGLAAAVRLVQLGQQVTLLEMAGFAGGRARQVRRGDAGYDNGQHILIGAYRDTLALMRQVGADPAMLLLRQPLALPAGAPMLAFVRAAAGAKGWAWRTRLALLVAAADWLRRGFSCPPLLTVQQLCQGLPTVLQQDLINPLCVAALNTPAELASAQVFLRVLQDALFSGAGSADLLLPRAPLSALLPEPAWAWLRQAGARCETGQRVLALARSGTGWRLETASPNHPHDTHETHDAVVLACSATEAARLALPHGSDWARRAAALRHEPIVTAYLADQALRLPHPMLALRAGPDAPAQFVFDLQALDRLPGSFAWVVSGAGAWLTGAAGSDGAGLAACGAAVLRQARHTFPGAFAGPDHAVLQHLSAEKRATFAALPGLDRPGTRIADGLVGAGDYIAGPYPATLEGAVRSGLAAAQALA